LTSAAPKYWEDFHVGETDVHGVHVITEEEIVEFARTFDPQPFHVDAEAARASHFGGLVAAGAHTFALCMGLITRNEAHVSAGRGASGIEELRWLVPVRPGDTLTAQSRVVDAWPSERVADRGTVVHEHELVNQAGEVVLRFRGRGHWARRSPGPERAEAG